MVYLFILIAAFGLFGLIRAYQNNKKISEATAEIKSKWGNVVDDERVFSLISGYYNYCAKLNGDTLPDAVATDIDLENIFAYIDRTCSKPGQQYLYRQIRLTTKNDALLKRLDDMAETFKQDDDLRLNVQLELSRLGGKNAYYLHELFTSGYSPMYDTLLTTYIKLAGIIWLSCLTITILHVSPLMFLLTLALAVLNFYLHFINKRKIAGYIYSLPQLHILMQVVKKLTKLMPQTAGTDIADNLQNLGRLKRSLSFVSFQNQVDADPTDIGSSAWELIKMLLLIEPAMFLISIDRVRQHKADIEKLYTYLGQTDLAISILSLRLSLPYYSKPVFINNPEHLSVNGLYHPLVENCVPNNLQVSATQGILITGSNMSGKTTFIRAIAINAVLSQTLFTSCSANYQAPFLQVFTSIRVSDDIEEHKSYFQAEALSVLNILNQSTTNSNSSLIIIDEIFRGTNTIERIAAAKAILSYLTANKKFVFVSTHDLELAELLGDEYAVYSFEEIAANNRLEFDYRIKPGILKNKNGIAILLALGYPESVIADANAMSDTLRKKYQL